MMHGVIGMCGIIQVLIEIACFGSKIFIEGPAETREYTVLIEAGLPASRCRIDSYEEFIPGDQAQTRFEFQRVQEANHLAWAYPDIIAIARYEVDFNHGSEGESANAGG